MTEYFVDIWRGRTDSLEDSAEYWQLLSDAERDKAERLINAQVRVRYISARGLLRKVLAAYLTCDPGRLQFALGAHGKPYLPGKAIYFNLSHSRDSVLLAVSNLEDVGVDIEAVKPRKSMLEMARRCFSEKEFTAWLLLSPPERISAFFRLWTIKEAFVKAVGRGLAVGLERCEIDIRDYGRFLAVPEEYGDASTWKIVELACDVGFSAALVVPNVTCQVGDRDLAMIRRA